ncbi:unnamed protein product [Ambrosiozyma monospora]|uniref:Unnamed protein product n=1 Tax=Ambrosiozyma monospora TaxID=43982 RepID=A0ACB5U7F4_AMBMO|nr:unnamed protein product [Ambrosiozyma monospora]
MLDGDYSVSSSESDSADSPQQQGKKGNRNGTTTPESSLLNCSHLTKLPIQNLHLLLYLLRFLNQMCKPENIQITKMPSSNLAKIFQLSFFKSDDFLFSSPLMMMNNATGGNGVYGGNPSAAKSADDLLESYKVNEQLLKFWIESSDHVFNSVKSTIAKDEQIYDLLNSPMEEELKLRTPRTATEDPFSLAVQSQMY